MSEFEDRVKGLANKVAGSIKEGIGKVTNDHELEAEGKAQQVEGKIQEVTGKAKGVIKDITG